MVHFSVRSESDFLKLKYSQQTGIYFTSRAFPCAFINCDFTLRRSVFAHFCI